MIGDRIRQARVAGGMTQQEVVDSLAAEGVPLTKGGLSKYERGGSAPKPTVIRALGRILGVDLDTQNIDVLQSGLVKFSAGIAANDTSLFFGQAELFPASGGDVSVVSLPGTGTASTLTAGLVGQ